MLHFLKESNKMQKILYLILGSTQYIVQAKRILKHFNYIKVST